MFNFILSPLYRFAAAVIAVIGLLAIVYGKGRSDASARNKIQSYKETMDAIESATAARQSAAATPPERLRDSDGYRRD